MEGEQQQPPFEDYPIGVPLSECFQCTICAPAPKFYKRHGDLSKHVRRYHHHQLVFRCLGCRTIFQTVKACKAHQAKTPACLGAVPEESPLLPPLPTPTPGALAVQRCRVRNVHTVSTPQQQLAARTVAETPTAADKNHEGRRSVDNATRGHPFRAAAISPKVAGAPSTAASTATITTTPRQETPTGVAAGMTMASVTETNTAARAHRTT